MKKLIIAPSMLAADMACLRAEAKRALDAGADWLHVDIMDGRFVPNISFGSNIVRMLRKEFPLAFLDVHLMITKPDLHVKDFVHAGANLLTIHVEHHAEHNVAQTIQMIRDLGCKPAISINPPTPIELVFPFLSSVDLLLCMTVNPGFGGQSFIPEVMPKVRAAYDYCEKNKLDIDIEVDGGINSKTAKIAYDHGANVLVAGTSLFKAQNMEAAIQELKNL